MSTYLPPHISKEAQAFLKNFPPFEEAPPLQSDDFAGWEAMRNALHTVWQSFMEGLEFDYTFTDTTIADIPCVWMETPNTKSNDKILYYPAGLNDVVNVYKKLLKQGYASKAIAWFGDSAGGGLTPAGIMRLRAEQIPLPAAIGLISPWADLTGTGDTYQTLAKKDPMMYSWEATIEAVWAYCGEQDTYDPFISPIYGDFKDFPPILIQVGTKEILLSDAIRLYRKAKKAGVEVSLDVWEGMWHVFQALPQVPEAQQACTEMGVFLKKHLQ